MKVIYATGSLKQSLKNTCVAIGIFDGMHRGHQYLIKHMIDCARRLGARPTVITFFPHPAHVLRPDISLPYLASLSKRLELFKSLGVERCVIIRFNKSFARIDPQRFIKETLVQQMDVKAVFVGDDFRFGKDRAGDIALFKRLGIGFGFTMHPMKSLKQGGEPISSTRIRRCIADGKLPQARLLLGRDFSVEGRVVNGAGRGKGLGFPTANIKIDSDVMPPLGVYAVRMRLGSKLCSGVANIGLRPSFKEKNPQVHLEVHLFNFKRDIYNKTVEVIFLKKIREERRFPNPQALIAQITRDIKAAHKIIS